MPIIIYVNYNNQYNMTYVDAFNWNELTIFNSKLTLHFNDYNVYETRHENFHGKFSLCAEHLISSIDQEVLIG